jgi:tripartite-type tricarboxylate transporter receptor subunit TctC
VIVKQLNALLNQILRQPEVHDRMLAVGLEFTPNSPDDAAARLKSEALKWHSVVDRLGLLLD